MLKTVSVKYTTDVDFKVNLEIQGKNAKHFGD